jgi:hypothetical protein
LFLYSYVAFEDLRGRGQAQPQTPFKLNATPAAPAKGYISVAEANQLPSIALGQNMEGNYSKVAANSASIRDSEQSDGGHFQSWSRPTSMAEVCFLSIRFFQYIFDEDFCLCFPV